MAHSSEMRWAEASQEVATVSAQTLLALAEAEKTYLELFEVLQYAGGTVADLAVLLFKEEIEAGSPVGSPLTATTEQVAKVQDLAAAITSLHELYQCLNNVDVGQEDRAADLRRMS